MALAILSNMVKYLNHHALAEGLCQLIDNEELRKRLGTNARNNILRFSQDTIMGQWDALFHKVTNV